MLLSVVTGTHNRLSHLKAMMESVKKGLPPNFAPGVDYEFCVVDGASTDGTIDFLKNEPGVRLEQHGELRGAIAAFNDAAKMATGDYLLVANDDVVFNGYSVAKALAYVMDRPDVGCACMYQDRGGKELHVETIPLYRGEEGPEAQPYMQVGIVPRWLWEKAGGWGDGRWGSRTYGGDVYLSMRVLESGYNVEPVPGATIKDKELNDGLRKKNYAEERESVGPGGSGPGFWKTFPRVVFGCKPFENFEAPLIVRKRVLYAPIIEGGHAVQKAQKRGLRDALGVVGAVWEVDYDYSGESVVDAAEAWRPHVTLTQFHDESAQTREDAGRIRRATQGHMLNWCGDVWADQQLTPNFMDLLRLYDCHLVVNASLLPKYEATGIKAAYWQNSSESWVSGDSVEKAVDVIFLGNNYNPKPGESPYRENLARALKSLPCNVEIYGRNYPDDLASGESLYDYQKTGALYRTARLIIADNQYYEAAGFASDRLFMALASGGGMLLHERVVGMDKYMGLVSGEHYVEWENLDDLKKKVEYYLSNDEERSRIAAAGTREFYENHTYADRVEELRKLLSDISPRKHTISGMMIVKNEKGNIVARLDELGQFCDDVVIVDTGSDDGTVELVDGYEGRVKPRLFHFAWNNDFSAARNYAKSKCAGDWIFWLDGDDEIPSETMNDLKKFASWRAHETRQPGAILLLCKGSSRTAPQIRLFKNMKNLEWRGRIHESLLPSIKEYGVKAITYPLVIQHNGKPHTERDIKILQQEPDGWMKYYYMASSYAAVGNFDAALVNVLRACTYEADENTDFLRFCVAYFSQRTSLNTIASDYLEGNAYPDALLMRAEMESGSERVALLEEVVKAEMPMETPSAYFDIQKRARQELAKYHFMKAKEYIGDA